MRIPTASPRVLGSLQSLFDHGGSRGTGYVSILPVDQGIEHSAGASFAPNPIYFDPENIVKLAIEGGCNAVASTLGVLGSVARKYAHKIPFILKFNHNEFISYPNAYDQIRFASVKQAFDMGAAGVGATIYFGSEESKRQIQEVTEMFQQAHELGHVHRALVLPAQPGVQDQGRRLPPGRRSDRPGQSPRRDDRGRHHQAEAAGNERRLQRAQLRQDAQDGLLGAHVRDHPIDLTRYQLANCYMGRAGLINSGGASAGESDLKEAVKTAVINKRAGGMGLISGRKAFQRPMKEGVGLLNAIQDVYLTKEVTIA